MRRWARIKGRHPPRYNPHSRSRRSRRSLHRCSALAVCKGWRGQESELFSELAAPNYCNQLDLLPKGSKAAAPSLAEWLRWLAQAAARWRPGSLRRLQLDLRSPSGFATRARQTGSGTEDLDGAAQAALVAALEAVLGGHGGSLHMLQLGWPAAGLQPATLARIAGLLGDHAAGGSELRELELLGGLAAAETVAAARGMPKLSRLRLRPDCTLDYDAEGLDCSRLQVRRATGVPCRGDHHLIRRSEEVNSPAACTDPPCMPASPFEWPRNEPPPLQALQSLSLSCARAVPT